MAPRLPSQGPAWLHAEFERTGLPYSALGEYLGLDKSAITRIVGGDRALSGPEAEAARGYFTVVPPLHRALSAAIKKLQSAKTRKNLTSQLLQWLKSHEHIRESESGISFARLIETTTNESATLRADQIVAICRVLRISIESLVQNAGVHVTDPLVPDESLRERDAIAKLAAAARRWAGESGAEIPYRFERGRPSRIQKQKTETLPEIVLKKTSQADEQFASCAPFVVDSDNARPLFHRGQTIYLERSSAPLRNGDLVAYLTGGEAIGGANAQIGQFRYESNEGILIDLPGGERIQIPMDRRSRIHRIGFCRF
jgi:hypothetical protein